MLKSEQAAAVHTLVNQIANKTFAELIPHCPKLVALVVETRSPGQDCLSPDCRTAGFVRTKQTDLYGRTTVQASHIEVHKIKHVEPCCDLLED